MVDFQYRLLLDGDNRMAKSDDVLGFSGEALKKDLNA